jgi:hypothetical protein
VEGNKYNILLVFAPVFDVGPNVTYSNTLCLARLEDQLKSGAILAYLFPSTGLKQLTPKNRFAMRQFAFLGFDQIFDNIWQEDRNGIELHRG